VCRDREHPVGNFIRHLSNPCEVPFVLFLGGLDGHHGEDSTLEKGRLVTHKPVVACFVNRTLFISHQKHAGSEYRHRRGDNAILDLAQYRFIGAIMPSVALLEYSKAAIPIFENI
jgi:hypothetical protein